MKRPVKSDNALIDALQDASWRHGYDAASTDEDGGPSAKDLDRSRRVVERAREALVQRLVDLRLYISRLQTPVKLWQPNDNDDDDDHD